MLPLADSTRWRLTELVLAPVLPFIKGSVVYTAFIREREWQTKCVQPFDGDPLPELPRQTMADIFMWGVIDWRFRIQRPQHLANGFAEKGRRVFYISTTFVRSDLPGFQIEALGCEGRLFQVRLHVKGQPPVCTEPPSDKNNEELSASVEKLTQWTQTQDAVSIVQHPFWYRSARSSTGRQLIYDCMDHHAGFSHISDGIITLEKELLRDVDVVVTTSKVLYDYAAKFNAKVALIRNAVDYDFFSVQPTTVFRDKWHRRVIGYYGAIANWLDLDLLEKVALHFRECVLLLVGADECSARKRFAALPNVHFTGEVKYEMLPHYLYGMNACLLPFKRTPLTLATNPVKVYEYLAAGKPVIAMNLPELIHFGNQVAVANSHSEFLSLLDGLSGPSNGRAVEDRRAFASGQTWQARADEFATWFDT